MDVRVQAAIISAITAIILFFIKEIILQNRKRKKFATRLLAHCCRTLPEILERDPSLIDFSSSVNLVEKYIDVYMGQADLDEAWTCFLSEYLYWKSGLYMGAPENITELSKQKLRKALHKAAANL